MIWSIQNTNIKNSFRLVNASFLGYLKPDRHYKFNERYLDLWIKIHERTYQLIYNLSKTHFSKINPDFNIGLDGLENPLTASKPVQFYLDNVADKIEVVSDNYEKGGIFITDSGGLQLFRAKIGMIKDNPKNIEKKLYNTVFPLQSLSNFAMAFDHIPVDFTYDAIKDSAIKTAKNIQEQIEIFDSVNGRASILPIFSPVVHPEAIDKWADVLIDNLPWDNKRLQSGIAFGGIIYGKDNAALSPNKMLYITSLIFRIQDKLKKVFGKNYKLPFIHLLGLIDKKDISILILLPLLRYVDVLSSDGRSFVMGFVIGKSSRFKESGILKRYAKIGKGELYKELALESLLPYEDLIKEYFEIKDLHQIINESLNYFDVSKRNDLNTSCHELLLLTETHCTILHTVMKTIYDIENNIDVYKSMIDFCYNEPELAFKKFKSVINLKSNLVESDTRINIEELL